MHIETRKVGVKKKFYLAHSFRDGEKIRKIRVYLGKNLSKKILLKKRKEAKEKISKRLKTREVLRDPFRHAISPEEMNRLRTLEARGDIRVIHLDEEAWTKFTKAFTYDTNAIEGSTITSSEVAGILEENKWPETKERSEISETYGVAEAVYFIRKTKIHLSLDFIKELHRIVFKNSKPFAGKFREMGVEVIVADNYGNIVHRGTPSQLVVNSLKRLIKWYEKNKRKYPALVLATVVHNNFETIHPFRDGNGRVGRLLMNNILLKHGMPPVNIELKNRKQYYAALRTYQENGNIKPMIKLMLKEYSALRKLVTKG